MGIHVQLQVLRRVVLVLVHLHQKQTRIKQTPKALYLVWKVAIKRGGKRKKEQSETVAVTRERTDGTKTNPSSFVFLPSFLTHLLVSNVHLCLPSQCPPFYSKFCCVPSDMFVAFRVHVLLPLCVLVLVFLAHVQIVAYC